MNAVVSVKLEAEWKDGVIPNPGKIIMTGGNPKSLEIIFELLNGEHKVVVFYGVQGLSIYSRDNKTIFEYQAVAPQGGDVFGMKPKNIVAITQIGFATYGLHLAALASPNIRFLQLGIQFL